jgi:hypothetical protein
MLAKDIKQGEVIKNIFDVGEVKDYSFTDKETGEEVQRLKFVITSNRRDRDKDIVEPAGAMTDDFAKNPVMLWAHQYDQLPIARAVEMERYKEAVMDKDGSEGEAHRISALVTFQPDSNYHESYSGIRGSMIYKMYAS